MRKRRQPNSAGFCAPSKPEEAVDVAPVVAVETAEEPVVAEPAVADATPEVVDEVEAVEPVTEPAVKEVAETEDETTDEVAF